MPIELFTKSEFESSLPVHKLIHVPLWIYGGFKGEHWYYLQVTPNIRIQIWSSIDSSGRASGTGLNSIRCYLTDNHSKPRSNKLQAHVTRLPGWHLRLKDQLTRLWKMGMRVSNPCMVCGSELNIFLCKKGDGKGSMFTKCANGHKQQVVI